MSSNYPSAFHIIFNKSALLFQLILKAVKETSHFLGPLASFKRALLKCLKTSLPLEHLCGEKRESLEWFNMLLFCQFLSNQGTHTLLLEQRQTSLAVINHLILSLFWVLVIFSRV